jgi:crotonobetainyl-CoA:carnitine CoA-transferase CaiB-like acyl-CoA transferase
VGGALCELKVLDLSRILAGPWAGQLLADLGAEVIKVERPGKGDDTRQWGPPFVLDPDGRPSEESTYFQCANRGKKSICLDITQAADQRIVRELALESDVLIENFKTGGLKKYGLDFETLARENPRLVYCSITGFGQTGPYAQRPGYDPLIQAMGGLMSVTGEADGRPGAGPQKVGVALTDILTGLYATVGILAAITERETSGKGQHIDMSLLDVTAACLANQATGFLAGGVAPRRLGNVHPSIVPFQSFESADGHFVLTVGNDEQFRRLAEVLGQPELGADARFATNGERVAHRDLLIAILSDAFRTRPTEHWLAECEAKSVPAGPINSVEQVFADPQVLARGMRLEMDHGLGHPVSLPGNPIKLSRTPIEYDQAPPLLDEHREQILDAIRRGRTT